VGRKCTTATPVPSKKRQVRKNKNVGSSFEITMLKFFNEYLRKNNIKGICFRLPDGRRCNQPVDLLIDSKDFSYAACECKSIYDSALTGGKLYFSKLGNISKETHVHQFVKQHNFLLDSERNGMIAFQFRDMKKIFIVPHQLIYERVLNGELYVTVDYIIANSFDIDDKDASLKSFVKRKCKTLDD